MSALANERCLNHETREAVCRCPECRNFFCRECVSEHGTRLLCAICIARFQEALPAVARNSPQGRKLLFCALGLFVAWLLFYLAGWSVLQFRDSVPVALLVKMNA
jgi:hypothetical protein